jgi:phosphate transport system permease protein
MMIGLILILILPFALAVGLSYKSGLLFREGGGFGMLFSSDWRPQEGHFGFMPFIVSSLWVTCIAILLAGPICVFSAINLTFYAHRVVSKVMQVVIDILAGIPSVVYGVWGILVLVPLVSHRIAPLFSHESSGYTLLTGGLVLAVMIIPFILNILLELFRTVPPDLIDASLSVGATKWQTIKRVVLKKTMPGILSSVSLGISRAFGETIAVLMVVGNVIKIPKSIFDPAYPLPALIANNYGEMLSIPRYDSALMFAALLLFIIILIFNILARRIIRGSEKYT